MSKKAHPHIVPLSETTQWSRTEGEYFHFFIRNVPIMTRLLLKPGARTRAHLHEAEEQSYYVIKGKGRLIAGEMTHDIGAQMAALIPPGMMHWIENTADDDLEVLMQYLWPGEPAAPIFS